MKKVILIATLVLTLLAAAPVAMQTASAAPNSTTTVEPGEGGYMPYCGNGINYGVIVFVGIGPGRMGALCEWWGWNYF